jgi:hypothetical protein
MRAPRRQLANLVEAGVSAVTLRIDSPGVLLEPAADHRRLHSCTANQDQHASTGVRAVISDIVVCGGPGAVGGSQCARPGLLVWSKLPPICGFLVRPRRRLCCWIEGCQFRWRELLHGSDTRAQGPSRVIHPDRSSSWNRRRLAAPRISRQRRCLGRGHQRE